MFLDEGRGERRARRSTSAASRPPHYGYGRFLQTDPLGYEDGLNWYNYVGSDPVNATDPTGLLCVGGGNPDAGPAACAKGGGTYIKDVDVTGRRQNDPCDGVSVNAKCYSGDAAVAVKDAFAQTAMDRGEPVETGDIVIIGEKPKKAPSIWSRLVSIGKGIICRIGNLDLGGGADVYAGLGGSVGGSYKVDLTTGQFGGDVYGAVGVGLGAEAGPTITFSSSGNTIVSANVITQVGAGYGTAAVGTRTLMGTSPGQTSVTFGKAGSPIGFVNGGAAVGLHTPKLYGLGC